MIRIIIPFLFFIFFSCGSANEKQWEKTRKDFVEMPLPVRPNPLWFWNNAEVMKDELSRQISLYKKDGYGGLSILPFGNNFKPEYLSDSYFDMYRSCVEETHKSGLTLWIYDEYGFPSGTAGDVNGDGFGRFKHKYPAHTNKRLDKVEFIYSTAGHFEADLPDGKIMAIVAMDTITYDCLNLLEFTTESKLSWNVPEGNWKIMIFTCVDAGNSIVDYMSQEAVNLYIGMTHDEYYKRFSSYFGNTIIGTFFDEPTLYYAQGRSWTPDFNEKFEKKYGFNPALYYPALWYSIGPKTEEARNYLFGFRSELYAEGYTKQVNDWSKKHGILATGHQDNEEIVNAVGTSGDLMKCFKFLDVPGIDKIGGGRPTEKFYKIVSSAAHNWDHSLVMSETYGAMGNISWNTIFGIAMDQYVKGINILIPHAVWYNDKNVTFLPELSSRNPLYADSLNVFTDYLARLNSIMQNNGRWIGDIAILYPINTMQSGHYMDGPLSYYQGGVKQPLLDYADVGVTVSDSLCNDFMFLHPEVLDEQCSVFGGKLLLNNQVQYNSFSTLIIPGSSTMSLSNLKKIKEFVNAGGYVIFTTLLPRKATIQKDDKELNEIIKGLLDNKNATFVELPTFQNLRSAFEKNSTGYSLRFNKGRVKNIHKIYQEKNIWFFANPDQESKDIEIELSGKYELTSWDPHTGATDVPLSTSYKNGKTIISFQIDAVKSMFVIEK